MIAGSASLTVLAKDNEQQCHRNKDNELEKLKYEVKAQYARRDCQFLNDYVEKAELRIQIDQQKYDLNRKERIIQEKIEKIRELQQQLNEVSGRYRERSRDIEERRYDNNNNDRRNNDYQQRGRGGYNRGYQPRPLNNYGSQYNQNYQREGGRGGYGNNSGYNYYK